MHGSGLFAILESLTSGEVLMVLLVALLVLGPERLPSTARSIGRWIAKARTAASGLHSEVQSVLDDPAMQPLREVGELVASPRRKLMEYALEAERDAEAARAEADAAKRSADAAAETAKAAAEAAAHVRKLAEDAPEAPADAPDVLEAPPGTPEDSPRVTDTTDRGDS
ncbi:MAG: twin-arginine translocase TatA/TatE family subunit [Microthrixaceae bacterium]